jgi:N-formylglutamate deformylase
MSGPNIIFHVPHSSILIPEVHRSAFSLSDGDLTEELRCMTDWHTADLFAPSIDKLGQGVEFPVSRLLVDPERFADDERECMAAVGMGVLYSKTSNGKELRSIQFTDGECRDRLLSEFYFPHHMTLQKMVEDRLNSTGSAMIVDCHSFPSVPLLYELNQNLERPDICIGTDDFHTPNEISSRIKEKFVEKGYRVELNAPFSGAIVPENFYGVNPNVYSVMIEVNRSLYMSEDTTEKSPSFEKTALDIAFVLEAVFCPKVTNRNATT